MMRSAIFDSLASNKPFPFYFHTARWISLPTPSHVFLRLFLLFHSLTLHHIPTPTAYLASSTHDRQCTHTLCTHPHTLSLGRYTPGRGTLRLVVVTDGDDCLSPGEYRGARGMNPLMRELKERGFSIEWCACVFVCER
jgi:hypothetical protein